MFQENLDVFFSSLDSVEATFTVDGESRVVRGFFDESFFDQSIGEIVPASVQPRFSCKLSDVADIKSETPVTLNGKPYSVVQVWPDGAGTATVHLAYE
ncbi:MAG: hypothetical protein PW734_06910 [Verrucomicrobium sp.]|nr:hypothetical protein [Verrucomicrobium sp.]